MLATDELWVWDATRVPVNESGPHLGLEESTARSLLANNYRSRRTQRRVDVDAINEIRRRVASPAPDHLIALLATTTGVKFMDGRSAKWPRDQTDRTAAQPCDPASDGYSRSASITNGTRRDDRPVALRPSGELPNYQRRLPARACDKWRRPISTVDRPSAAKNVANPLTAVLCCLDVLSLTYGLF